MFTSKGSSQSGIGNSNSIYCGGFLNDFPAATTDAKIRGNLSILDPCHSWNWFQIFFKSVEGLGTIWLKTVEKSNFRGWPTD